METPGRMCSLASSITPGKLHQLTVLQTFTKKDFKVTRQQDKIHRYTHCAVCLNLLRTLMPFVKNNVGVAQTCFSERAISQTSSVLCIFGYTCIYTYFLVFYDLLRLSRLKSKHPVDTTKKSFFSIKNKVNVG